MPFELSQAVWEAYQRTVERLVRIVIGDKQEGNPGLRERADKVDQRLDFMEHSQEEFAETLRQIHKDLRYTRYMLYGLIGTNILLILALARIIFGGSP